MCIITILESAHPKVERVSPAQAISSKYSPQPFYLNLFQESLGFTVLRPQIVLSIASVLCSCRNIICMSCGAENELELSDGYSCITFCIRTK